MCVHYVDFFVFVSLSSFFRFSIYCLSTVELLTHVNICRVNMFIFLSQSNSETERNEKLNSEMRINLLLIVITFHLNSVDLINSIENCIFNCRVK